MDPRVIPFIHPSAEAEGCELARHSPGDPMSLRLTQQSLHQPNTQPLPEVVLVTP